MGLLTSTAGVAVKGVAAPYVAMVAPFWPLIWRAALVAAIFWGGWHYGGKSAERDLEQFKVQQAEAAVAAVTTLNTEVAERQAELTKQEKENAKTIADLKAEQAARPAPVVRVCRAAANPAAVPRVPGVAGRAATDGGGAGVVPEGVGVDIGAGTQRLIDRADIVRRKCIAHEERTDWLATRGAVTVPVRQ